jgi:hypothetical protein
MLSFHLMCIFVGIFDILEVVWYMRLKYFVCNVKLGACCGACSVGR